MQFFFTSLSLHFYRVVLIQKSYKTLVSFIRYSKLRKLERDKKTNRRMNEKEDGVWGRIHVCIFYTWAYSHIICILCTFTTMASSLQFFLFHPVSFVIFVVLFHCYVIKKKNNYKLNVMHKICNGIWNIKEAMLEVVCWTESRYYHITIV